MSKAMFKKLKITLVVFGLSALLAQLFLPASVSAKGFSFQNLTTFAAPCDIPVQGGGLPTTIFVPWYKYLGDSATGTCKLTLPTKTTDCSNGQSSCTDLTKTVTLVAIAIVELLTRVSALVAAGFILYGSFQYISSQGQPENLNKAKTTIANAIIGFAIIVLSIAVVQFLGRIIR